MKKFRIWEIIVYGALIILTFAFGLLKSVWSGFTYFSGTCAVLIMIIFVVNRILYIRLLKEEYDENLPVYLAEMLNLGYITKEQYEKKDEQIVKGYYKEYNSSKRIQILIIVVVCLILASILGVFIGI